MHPSEQALPHYKWQTARRCACSVAGSSEFYSTNVEYSYLSEDSYPVHVVSDLGMLVPAKRASAFFTTMFDAGINLAECILAVASAKQDTIN